MSLFQVLELAAILDFVVVGTIKKVFFLLKLGFLALATKSVPINI